MDCLGMSFSGNHVFSQPYLQVMFILGLIMSQTAGDNVVSCFLKCRVCEVPVCPPRPCETSSTPRAQPATL